MSVLHILPRLASWGNLYSKGERVQDYGQDGLEDLISLRKKISHDRDLIPLTKDASRRKISYWSDYEEDNNFNLQRFNTFENIS